jgi:hypothetical protein
LHKAERLQVKRIRYLNQYEAYQADSRAPPVPRELIELIVRRVDARHFRRPVDFVEQVQQIYPTGKSVRFIRTPVKPLAQKYFCLSEM